MSISLILTGLYLMIFHEIMGDKGYGGFLLIVGLFYFFAQDKLLERFRKENKPIVDNLPSVYTRRFEKNMTKLESLE